MQSQKTEPTILISKTPTHEISINQIDRMDLQNGNFYTIVNGKIRHLAEFSGSESEILNLFYELATVKTGIYLIKNFQCHLCKIKLA